MGYSDATTPQLCKCARAHASMRARAAYLHARAIPYVAATGVWIMGPASGVIRICKALKGFEGLRRAL